MVIGRDLRREIKNRENFVRTDFRKIRAKIWTRKNFPLYVNCMLLLTVFCERAECLSKDSTI